jgi:dTMP kinase
VDKKTMTGLFLSLDGIDGTGKTTQGRLLADWLRGQGRTVVACTDPGGTPVGQSIRELLLHQRHALTPACEALLFMASRAQLVSDVIRPALDAGHVVVSDRFLLANVVYQGHAGGLDPQQLWEVGRLSTGGMEPDLTLVLDLSVEAAAARRQQRRGGQDRMERRDDAYRTRVRQGFLDEANRQPQRIRVIDANGSVAEVQERIRKEVADVLAARGRA